MFFTKSNPFFSFNHFCKFVNKPSFILSREPTVEFANKPRHEAKNKKISEIDWRTIKTTTIKILILQVNSFFNQPYPLLLVIVVEVTVNSLLTSLCVDRVRVIGRRWIYYSQ